MFNKVPRVPGMMVFRKDLNRLYSRSNYSWYEVADERKVGNKDPSKAPFTLYRIASGAGQTL